MSMFCPNCGQERSTDQTIYCSRCGFLLTGVTELIRAGGKLTSQGKGPARSTSKKTRGIRKGIFIFLLSFLIVPLIAIATLAAGAEPYFVVISAILLSVGGLLRVAYALMFEDSDTDQNELEPSTESMSSKLFSRKKQRPALQDAPASVGSPYIAPAGNWRDTNDLQPRSVTENTTRLLDDERSQ